MAGIPIQIDPFFDGGDAYPSGPAQREQRMPSTYRDASSERFETVDPRGMQTGGMLAGRPVSSVLRPSVKGMNMGGTIIPHATEGGTPEGFHPNMLDDVEVIIDPHIAGQRTRLGIGQLTEAAIQYGQQVAQEAVPQVQGQGSRRFKAAAAYHGMAQFVSGDRSAALRALDDDLAPDAPQPQAKTASAPSRVAVMSGHQVSQAVPRAPRQGGSPMSLLRKPAAPPPRAVDSPTEEALYPVKPAVRVNFEIDLELANGKHHTQAWSAKYHDVSISTAGENGMPYAISFLWDNSDDDEPYIPPSGDDSPELALEIVGRGEVYLVRALPFQYKSLMDGRFQQIQFLVLKVADSEG